MNLVNAKSLTTLVTSLALTAVPAAALALDASDGGGSSAEATAVEVEGVIVISDSEAEEGHASSTGVSVMGEEVSGTEQEEEGTSESAIIDSADAGVPEDGVNVKVGHSSSTVEGDGSSSASSDFLVVDVGDGLIRIEVLSSDAHSEGSAESDAVVITSTEDPTGEGIHVLHAEAEGSEGEAGVIYLGGEGIITDEQTGGLCATELAIVGADLICVAATEAGGVESSVAGDVAVQGETIGTVVGVETAPSQPEAEAAPQEQPDVQGEDLSSESAPSLPRTGMNAMGLLLTSAGALTTGNRLRRRN